MPTHDEVVAWIRSRTTRELLALLGALEGALDLRLAESGVPAELPNILTGPALDPRRDGGWIVDVVLVEVGPDRMGVLRAVRTLTGLPLVAARDLLERCPVVLREEAARDEAEAWRKVLAPLGARIELR